jgi:hypothetical protein
MADNSKHFVEHVFPSSEEQTGGITLFDYFTAHAPIMLSDIPKTAYVGGGCERDLTDQERIEMLAGARKKYARAIMDLRRLP